MFEMKNFTYNIYLLCHMIMCYYEEIRVKVNVKDLEYRILQTQISNPFKCHNIR